VTNLMEDFLFGEAQRQIHDFMWGEFCDWYIEIAKIRLRDDAGAVPSPIPVLTNVLEASLRLLHPYMPFITEELWQNLKVRLPSGWQDAESIMVSTYPQTDETAVDPQAEQIMETVIDIIRSVRNARSQYRVESAKWIEVQIYADKLTPSISAYSQVIQTLARAQPVTVLQSQDQRPRTENTLVLVLKDTEVFIPMESMIDLKAENNRLQKEIEQSEAEIAQLETRLKDKEFLTKAPVAVVQKEQNKLTSRKDKLERLKQELARFQT
jgi:valyl-tRNA synthetase